MNDCLVDDDNIAAELTIITIVGIMRATILVGIMLYGSERL